jgi:hypothetical protein
LRTCIKQPFQDSISAMWLGVPVSMGDLAAKTRALFFGLVNIITMDT